MNYFKRLTSHGSVNIPRVLRTEVGLEEKDPVEVILDMDNRIIVRPMLPHCIFCGTMGEHVKLFKNKGVCKDCLAQLKEEHTC